jgi:hypothetical protein
MRANVAAPARRPTRAAEGAYGVPSYDATEVHAKALLRDIQIHLGDAGWFTREDLLHLPTFEHVATITRYRYVGLAVTRLVESKRLYEVSRTELCLAGRTRDYHTPQEIHEEFGRTIRRLTIARIGTGEAVTVADILNDWRTDQHLTTNSKRVAVRHAFRLMVREGTLHAAEFGHYTGGGNGR